MLCFSEYRLILQISFSTQGQFSFPMKLNLTLIFIWIQNQTPAMMWSA